MRWQATYYIARCPSHFGGLHSHWLARYCCGLVRFFHLTWTNHMGGGSLLNHHQCAASTWMMRRLPQDNGASALTTHQLQMERRVIESIKWMGIIRRPWLTRASGGNLARTPGLHPTLYEKCHGIFNDHRESGPQFNVSSERRKQMKQKESLKVCIPPLNHTS